MEIPAVEKTNDPIDQDDIKEITDHIHTFNVLQAARDTFGGAEKRLYGLIDIMDPHDLMKYLLNRGWQEKTRFPEPGGKILSYGENHEVVIFLPMDKEYIDYRSQMYEALRIIVDTTSVFGRL